VLLYTRPVESPCEPVELVDSCRLDRRCLCCTNPLGRRCLRCVSVGLYGGLCCLRTASRYQREYTSSARMCSMETPAPSAPHSQKRGISRGSSARLTQFGCLMLRRADTATRQELALNAAFAGRHLAANLSPQARAQCLPQPVNGEQQCSILRDFGPPCTTFPQLEWRCVITSLGCCGI
jgi:hypothetical protein